jgi:hypothetical protein
MAVCDSEPRRGHIGVPASSGAAGCSAALLFATRSSRHIKATRPGVEQSDRSMTMACGHLLFLSHVHLGTVARRRA